MFCLVLRRVSGLYLFFINIFSQLFLKFSKIFFRVCNFFKKSTIWGTFSKTFFDWYLRFKGGPRMYSLQPYRLNPTDSNTSTSVLCKKQVYGSWTQVWWELSSSECFSKVLDNISSNLRCVQDKKAKWFWKVSKNLRGSNKNDYIFRFFIHGATWFGKS